MLGRKIDSGQNGGDSYLARIYIADDDMHYVEAFRAGLSAFGHIVDAVASGDTVIEDLGRTAYDIVFLDVVMPGGGAISLVHKIRARFDNLPIVVMTGHAELFEAPVFRDGFQLANARIRKSTSLLEIKALVDTLSVR